MSSDSSSMNKDEQILALQEQVNLLTNRLQAAVRHEDGGGRRQIQQGEEQQEQNDDDGGGNNFHSGSNHGSGNSSRSYLYQQAKNYQHNEGSAQSKKMNRLHLLSPHTNVVKEVVVNNEGTRRLSTLRQRMGRSASIASRQVLDSIPDDIFGSGTNYHTPPPHMQRVLNMFQNPTLHIDYLNSTAFGKDVYKLASKVRSILEKEPRVVFIQSPVYVFGDIHGNIEDLHFFSDNIWRLGMNLTAGNFLFLGDYVDRGLSCLECLAYLFMMKIQLPNKVFLLRGNHETRDVNGWEEHYLDRSFMYQCRARFGDDIGYRIWEVCNQAFDRLPLAAVIDQDVFCVHGGIPRPISLTIHDVGPPASPTNHHHSVVTPSTLTQSSSSPTSASTTRIQDILSVPRVAGINPPYEHEDELYQQVASDCIWSDPASEEQEMTTVDPDTGFGESLRGGGAICFGNKAVTNFLQQESLSFIMRAHEAHAEGVAVCKGARVFTVFSTSRDHNQGEAAMAGCMLVDNDKLQVINRSPAYKNQYVHRRDSISVAMLSDGELQKRMRLGLVTDTPDSPEHDDDDEEEDEEDWEEFEDSSCANDNNPDESDHDTSSAALGQSNHSVSSHHSHHAKDDVYVIDKSRRSSVDINSLSDYSYGSSHESTHEWENERASDHGSPFHQTVSSPSTTPNKRPRPRQEPSVASIYEGVEETETDEDEEIETVDGDQDHQDLELRDAT